MPTCHDCLNYRTQRGLVWCRYGLIPPKEDVATCPHWDDADGPLSGGHRQAHVCTNRCERLHSEWAEGTTLKILARRWGISMSTVSKIAKRHSWPPRHDMSGWGGRRDTASQT